MTSYNYELVSKIIKTLTLDFIKVLTRVVSNLRENFKAQNPTTGIFLLIKSNINCILFVIFEISMRLTTNHSRYT